MAKKTTTKKKSSSKKKTESLKERMRRKKEELKSKGGKGNIIYIKEGTLRVRPLFCGGENDFVGEVSQFYLGGEIKGVISPASIGLPCAIYEKYEELRDSDDPDDKDWAKKLVPRTKYLMPVAVYSDEKGKKVDEDQSGKMVMLAKGLYEEIIDLFLDEEWGDMTDTEDGYDLKLKRSGTGKNDTEYSCSPCRNTPTPKAYHKEIDLQEMLKEIFPTYEQTQEYINKFLHSVPDEDEEDDKPKKKKKGGKKKRKSDLD